MALLVPLGLHQRRAQAGGGFFLSGPPAPVLRLTAKQLDQSIEEKVAYLEAGRRSDMKDRVRGNSEPANRGGLRRPGLQTDFRYCPQREAP